MPARARVASASIAGIGSYGAFGMTSIERTAYPRFKRLITARELHLFFSPGLEEAQWAAGRTESDEHQLALLLMLKSYQRMGCFPKLGEVPDMVADFVRRALNLPEGTRATHASGRSAEQHRALVRQRVGVRYDAARARELARETIRAEAESKNNPADLINVALEKLVEAGLELPSYSTLDHMASTVRAEANTAICAGIWERTGEAGRSGLLALLDVEDLGPGGKSLFNRLKQPAQRATWSHFRNQENHLEWVDGLGDTGAWLTGVAPGKVTDFAGEAAAADAGVLRDYALAKRVALIACLAHKARMRARDDLATMFCKRVAIKVKKARDELEEIRRHQQALVEALAGNYRTLLQKVDAGGPAQEAQARAAELAGGALKALEDLDEADTAGDVARLLGGTRKVSPALLALMRALRAQSGGIGAVTAAVDAFGGFAGQYAQIEKVSAHHGDNWEVLLHEQLQRDRAVMFELSDKLELTATSEDSRVLDALAHARRHKSSREYIPAFDGAGNPAAISFATQNWQGNVRDRARPGSFVRRHFEAMVFCNLADELRTGDVAVAGSGEYADWSEQLLPWDQVEAKLPAYLAEVGLREEGDERPFDAAAFRAQLQDRLTEAAAAADSGYPDNEGLFIDPGTGVPTLSRLKAEETRASARRLEQEIRSRMPERTLLGIVARTAHWIEWWRRFGPMSGNDPKLKDPFGRYVITTFAGGTNMGPYEGARHIPGVSGHELSMTANRHFSIAKLNEAITGLVNAHARLDLSRAWGDGTTAAADGTPMDTSLNNLLAETC